jgi:nitroimidazol reductase NimA-like FMN-containing flavoprotein (pyridoxamine 5'-phosphate oxidase superfamily)
VSRGHHPAEAVHVGHIDDKPRDNLPAAGLEVPPGQRRGAQDAALETMSAEKCRTHLARGGIGRFLFVADRGPVAVPVNFAMVGDDVVFRTDDRTDAAGAAGQQKVSFEVDHIDDALSEGWSVLLTGAANILTRPDDLHVAAELGVEPWAGGGRDTYIRLLVEEMTGRRVCSASAGSGRLLVPAG